MYVIYDEVRLDPAMNSVSLNHEEWAINPTEHVMQHQPTRTVFQISVDDKQNESDPVTAADFASRLVAIDVGCPLPSPTEIVDLAQQSLALYLVATGYIAFRSKEPIPLPLGEAPPYVC